MGYDPSIHHRRSIRLKGYDYSQAGAYFVTVVAQGRELLFGDIHDGEMRLDAYGMIANETWQWLAVQYPHVELGAWVVMPNHVHGNLIIHPSDDGRSGLRPASTQRPYRPYQTIGLITSSLMAQIGATKRNICRS